MDADDGDLFLRWIDGDDRAGEDLTRRHYWSVHRFFELRAPRHADDLTQATFLACTEGRHRYLQMGSFRAFLFGIARRQLLLHLRSSRTQAQHIEFGSRDAAQSGITPSGLVAGREEQRLLLMAITRLPLYLQLTVQLHYWEGLKAIEIGAALGVPTSTVTTRLARARELIHGTIAAYPVPRARDALLRDLEGWARSLAGKPIPALFS
jgi:RNA polymerase sigma-70 factor (ECF subfamily)